MEGGEDEEEPEAPGPQGRKTARAWDNGPCPGGHVDARGWMRGSKGGRRQDDTTGRL